MPSKLDFYAQMADHTAKQVTGSFGEWTAFLETMGRLYKYPFHEQLMIFAQKPNATACADYDLWNKQMGRYVRRGSKGIALIDTSGDNPRLKYVFDVSDTGGRDNSRRLNLWEYKDEHQDAVTASLENRFGVSGEKGLADQLEQIASKLVTEYWNDNRRDILGILADSFLEEYDDYNVEVAFRNAATVSTTYALMSRCGLNPSDYFEHEDFLSVFDFNTRDTIAVLGSAVSNSSEQILRQVAIAVKNHEREASLQQQAERTQDYGEQFELHAERGLLYPESDLERDRDEAPGQVRTNEEEVSAGTQTSAVEPDDTVGEPVPASEGNRRDGEQENGTVDARTDEAERRNGGTESERPDDVGGLDEQPQKPSRRNNSRRTDSQLSEQLTLFDIGLFPTEQEQIAIIDEAESVRPTPFAFSFAQDDIDDVLRLASNTEDTRMVVASAFQKQKPMEEIVDLLKKEYHGGAGITSDNGEFSVWYAEDGIHLAKGRTARYKTSAQVISWEDAAERIGQLLQDGKYASNVELVEAEGHERMKLSHLLWYLRGDLSDEAREQNILSTLEDYRRGGFPDATARLAEDLKDPAFRERLAADYSAFLEAYKEDRNIMRFRYHKPHEIWNRLKDLDLPRREYTSDMAEVSKVGMFITEDEIDATLNRGSNVEGGKGRIYTYLTGSHNSKEKATFLKDEYGWGGSSHAVSGQGWIDSSGKGIRLRKPECADVELNWNKVLARFENIIRNGRYFTPEEQAKYDEMQTREGQFRRSYNAYNDLKHDHRDDIVLFKVGDFYEMYGEDAKAAAELLDVKLTTRAIPGAGRVNLCGIPAFNVEQATEKLRAEHSVTVGEFDALQNRYTIRSYGVLPAVEELSQESENEPVSVTVAQNETPTETVETPVVSREITQAEIDEALQKWNGDIESKRAVVRYMADHARERDTAAWLSKEYGGDVSKPLHITVAGFETTDRRDFYDLAIGNVPFGQYQVNDRAYNKLGFSIHDYFFAKALDQVRPGGVVAFVTSRYTMDKQSPEVRKYIAQRAELLGAIRLPNNAFKANAGTEVVSDIIFLQKRDRPIEIEPDWVHLGKNDDGFAINSYFIDNPEMVLGRQTSESTQYGKQDFTVEPYENLDLGVQLKYAIQNIKGTYAEAELPDLGDGEVIDTSIPADPNVKNYSYTVVDGDVYYRENSRMVKPELNATATERVKGMVELRDCVQKLIGQQMDGYISDETIRQTQRELNELYDNFTAKHGLINSRGNALAFADDSSYYLLCSLEVLDEDNNLKRKADMFTKRTIKPSEVVTSVDTASEALAVSIAEKAKVDMPYMSQLTGKTEEELASDLRGVIYMDFNRKPDGSYTWRTADDFLSGNVREKLAYYQKALEYTEGTEKHHFILDNVEALKTAQPKDLDASEIEVRLGATWIDKSYIQQFMVETFEPPYYLRRSIEVNYSPFSAERNITGKSQPSYSDVNAYMTYGTERANAYKILEDTLNLRDVRIYDTVTDPDGRERRVLNSKETTLAQQKQQAIKDVFRDWIWKDPDRRQELVTKYNELFNSTRPREYNGSHIVFSGMNPEIKLREHQKNAVAHILYGGNTLLAHEVGAGKSATRS